MVSFGPPPVFAVSCGPTSDSQSPRGEYLVSPGQITALTSFRRSYGELDLLFEQKVPARKFKTTVVNEFEGEGQAAQVGGAIVH